MCGLWLSESTTSSHCRRKSRRLPYFAYSTIRHTGPPAQTTCTMTSWPRHIGKVSNHMRVHFTLRLIVYHPLVSHMVQRSLKSQPTMMLLVTHSILPGISVDRQYIPGVVHCPRRLRMFSWGVMFLIRSSSPSSSSISTLVALSVEINCLIQCSIKLWLAKEVLSVILLLQCNRVSWIMH